MSLAILALRTAVPPFAIAQPDAARIAADYCCEDDEQARTLTNIYARTRIAWRGSVVFENDRTTTAACQTFFGSPDEPDRPFGPTTGERMRLYQDAAGALALQAASPALRASGVTAQEITHLVTVSCTGFAAPGFDQELIHQLGLSAEVQRTHIGFMGCHAALNGLRVVHAFAAGDPQARVLLCATELCSIHFAYGWNVERVVANALFADGAAALVAAADASQPMQLQRSNGAAWSTNGAPRPWRLVASGSFIFPESANAMSWTVGDHGFRMTLSARVPDLLRGHLPIWLDGWLERQGLVREDIASWAIHPGGPRIVSGVSAALNLPPDATAVSDAILAEHGNMSSPTVLFLIERLQKENRPRPCVALAFGPGLAVEAALFD